MVCSGQGFGAIRYRKKPSITAEEYGRLYTTYFIPKGPSSDWLWILLSFLVSILWWTCRAD